MSSVSKVFKKVREPNQLVCVCVTHPSIAFNFWFCSSSRDWGSFLSPKISSSSFFFVPLP